jgi:hypothetical protein
MRLEGPAGGYAAFIEALRSDAEMFNDLSSHERSSRQNVGVVPTFA